MLIREPHLLQFFRRAIACARALGIVIHSEVDLGHDDDLVARQVVLFDGFAEDDFGDAVTVRIRGVEGIDSKIIRKFDLLDGFSRTPRYPADVSYV